MLRTLGIPTFFLTLSTADLHWPEMVQAVASQYGKRLTHEDVLRMSVKQKSDYLHNNPVTGVCMFQYRVENFFSQYLLNATNPLGQISDHVIKIEFQMRGTPHAHCLLWVKDAPKIGRDTNNVVCAFIDKYITASTLPPATHETSHDNALVTRLQKHSHSDYCHRNKKCRFGFLKAPSLHTIISQPVETNSCDNNLHKAKQILEAMQLTLATTDITARSISDLCDKIGVTTEAYMSALSVSSKGFNIILKHDPCDIYINPSNRYILRLWRGDTDLQYVIDEVATIMYVCNYMTKGEKAMGETLKRVAKECKDDDIRTQMNKIKREFLGKRVVGLPESVNACGFCQCGSCKKSRKVVQVNTNMKAECVSLPKPMYKLCELDDDDDVFATSIIDRYAARPNIIGNMCLAEFAVSYDPVAFKNYGND